MGLYTKIQEAIEGSAEVQAYCTTEFSSPCKVFVGQDGNSPPKESDAPCVVITGRALNNVDDRFDTSKIAIGVTVSNSSAPVVSGNKVNYKGFEQADELGLLVRDVVLAMRIGSRVVVKFRTVLDIDFPLYGTEIEAEYQNIVSSKGL